MQLRSSRCSYLISDMPNKKNNELLQYAGLATQWLVMLAVALWIGMKIDKQISDSTRIFTISLPLLSLIVSLWQLIRKFDKPKK